MSLTICLNCHVSIRVESDGKVVYFDPWKLQSEPHDANVVLVSHSHFDHCSPEDIAGVSGPGTRIFAPEETAGRIPASTPLAPGQSESAEDIAIEAVPAYNIDKHFHPKENGWCGFVVTLGGKRVYFAGDTDLIPEMDDLENIDVALLPVGGTYTMNAAEAAEAVRKIGCKHAIPCHWGDVVGDENDAELFTNAAECPTTIIKPGESKIIAV